MCIIIGIIKNGEQNDKMIIDELLRQQLRNAHGSSVVAWKGQEKTFVRKMKFSREELEKILKKNDELVFHFRISTSGQINEQNCHLWEANGWHFAHNGFTSLTSKEHADSFVLLQKMVEAKAMETDISFKKVGKLYKEVGLTGKTVFVNTETDTIFLTGDYNFYSPNKETLIFASGILDFQDRQTVLGFTFNSGAKRISKGSKEGLMQVKNKTFKKLSDKFSRSKSYNLAEYYTADEHNSIEEYNPVQGSFMREFSKNRIGVPQKEYDEVICEQVEEVIEEQAEASWKPL